MHVSSSTQPARTRRRRSSARAMLSQARPPLHYALVTLQAALALKFQQNPVMASCSELLPSLEKM